MDQLSAVLEDLDAWLAAERPDLHPRLRPGLSERQLAELEARLAPYHLPADLVTVYRWHDGWEEQHGGSYVSLLPDCSFHALQDSIELYEMLCGLNQELDDSWNPLWFPAFGDQSGEFVELQPGPDLPAGFLWSFHSHDAEVYTSYDSVAALYRTTLELWRSGLLPASTPGPWLEIRHRIAFHNPAAKQPDGYSRLTRERFASLDWPESWLIAAGVARPTPADDGDVITIAELLVDPWCERPVRGEFRCAMASAAGYTGTLSDETGAIKVHVDRETTENFRLLSFRVEMIVRPVTEGETVEESMTACDFDNELEESLTRVFLERSAASFEAIRVVPLPG
jgi:cell wall assembly regulator SMI1